MELKDFEVPDAGARTGSGADQSHQRSAAAISAVFTESIREKVRKAIFPEWRQAMSHAVLLWKREKACAVLKRATG